MCFTVSKGYKDKRFMFSSMIITMKANKVNAHKARKAFIEYD